MEISDNDFESYMNKVSKFTIGDKDKVTKIMDIENIASDWISNQQDTVNTFTNIINMLQHHPESKAQELLGGLVTKENSIYEHLYCIDTHTTNSNLPFYNYSSSFTNQTPIDNKGAKPDYVCIGYPQFLEIKDMKQDRKCYYTISQCIEKIICLTDMNCLLSRCCGFASNGKHSWIVSLHRTFNDDGSGKEDKWHFLKVDNSFIFIIWANQLKFSKNGTLKYAERDLYALQQCMKHIYESRCLLSCCRIRLLGKSSSKVYQVTFPPTKKGGNCHSVAVKVNQIGTACSNEFKVIYHIHESIYTDSEKLSNDLYNDFYIHAALFYDSSNTTINKVSFPTNNYINEWISNLSTNGTFSISKTAEHFKCAETVEHVNEHGWWFNSNNNSRTFSCTVMKLGYKLPADLRALGWNKMAISEQIRMYLKYILHEAEVLHTDARYPNIMMFPKQENIRSYSSLHETIFKKNEFAPKEFREKKFTVSCNLISCFEGMSIVGDEGSSRSRSRSRTSSSSSSSDGAATEIAAVKGNSVEIDDYVDDKDDGETLYWKDILSKFYFMLIDMDNAVIIKDGTHPTKTIGGIDGVCLGQSMTAVSGDRRKLWRNVLTYEKLTFSKPNNVQEAFNEGFWTKVFDTKSADYAIINI
jgi:hypothetical protein